MIPEKRAIKAVVRAKIMDYFSRAILVSILAACSPSAPPSIFGIVNVIIRVVRITDISLGNRRNMQIIGGNVAQITSNFKILKSGKQTHSMHKVTTMNDRMTDTSFGGGGYERVRSKDNPYPNIPKLKTKSQTFPWLIARSQLRHDSRRY
jgi:hypothetical protein